MSDPSLDPEDWSEFRAIMHAAVDDAVDDLARIREGPVWRPVPNAVKQSLREPLPRRGAPLGETYARFRELVAPFSIGNRHPGFFGWVHGAGSAAGILGELLSAAFNANLGGREHGAVYVERTVIAWFAELFGMPAQTSGLLTSGTSMSNLLGIVAAREAALGPAARSIGIAGAPLVSYAPAGVHDSVPKALRIAGLGDDAFREIAVDERGATDIGALRAAVVADRAAGMRPFLVVANAGSIDGGAFDRLDDVADVCAEHRLWLHVDGAFGALAIASPRHAHLVAGIERADSIAFDAHKWFHAPYGIGVALFRDEAAHRAAFSTTPGYLARAERGTAAGAPWYTDYGIELSRPFRALSIWFILRHYGIERLGAAIGHTCDLATDLGARIAASHDLELALPVVLNVVCFYVVAPHLSAAERDALTEAIAVDVQESGAAVPSTTSVCGRRALRVAIVNHRTRTADLERLLAAVRSAAGRRLTATA